MNLLAIDTCTDACSVGLLTHGRLLLDHRIARQQHAALVLPMVDGLMQQAGLLPQQLDGLVFGRGPGSFTGVRIGIAVSQGIALGCDIGVVGISTLRSIAQGCFRQYGDTHVAVSVDARMDEVYLGAFIVDAAGHMQPVLDECLLSPSDLPSLATLPAARLASQAAALSTAQSAAMPSWHWAGSGAERYAGILTPPMKVDDALIRRHCLPNAADLLTLGEQQVRQGKLLPAEEALPVYLRDKVALTTAEQALLK